MEDKFLVGNEIIEKALADANANMCHETIMALVNAIQERMVADGHLLLPVEYPDPEDLHHFQMRCIPDENDEIYLACFTSEEELHKGEPTAVMSQFIDVFIEAVLDSDQVKGIMINPFGITCRLPKGVLQIIMEARQPSENDYIRENRLLEKAIHFATSKHAGQLRKGTTIPYIVHPLETMIILRSMNADTNLLIAGLLHDTVEDTDATAEEIAEIFGTDVSALVNGHSEDKSKTWKQRKTHAIKELAEASRRMKMLVMADKVSNLRSMAADHHKIGDALWERFNAPVDKQAWYYSGIQDSLWDMQNDPDASGVYWEMVGLYKDLFVKYYRSIPSSIDPYEYLLQISAHGDCFRLDRGNPQWSSIHLDDASNLAQNNCQQVSRMDAEALEDDWNTSFWDRIEIDLQNADYTLVHTANRNVVIHFEERCFTLSGADYRRSCRNRYALFFTMIYRRMWCIRLLRITSKTSLTTAIGACSPPSISTATMVTPTLATPISIAFPRRSSCAARNMASAAIWCIPNFCHNIKQARF